MAEKEKLENELHLATIRSKIAKEQAENALRKEKKAGQRWCHPQKPRSRDRNKSSLKSKLQLELVTSVRGLVAPDLIRTNLMALTLT